MKLLHVADLHLGKRLNGMSLIEDQRFILEKIASIASGQAVDAVAIAGDIYDKASPSAEAVSLLDAFLTHLADDGVRVLAIPGNHDSPERIAYAQDLLSKQGVCFAPVYEGKVASVVLEDGHGEVVFWLLPYLKPSDVRRFFPDVPIGDDYSAMLAAVLEGCDLNPSARNVIVSHQLVTAFGATPDRADDEIKLGGIDNVDYRIYDKFDYVALGHVHRSQKVGRDTVRYAGSPLKYSFSEACYAKSVTLVELGPKAEGDKPGACVETTVVPLEALHDLREVKASLDELLETPASEAEGALDYLHVTLTDDHPRLDAMAKIHRMYPNAMVLDYEYALASGEAGPAGIVEDPDDADAAELFARFFEAQLGREMDDVQSRIVERIVRSVDGGGEPGARQRAGKAGS